MKTARFTDVVKTCGSPESYLLWVPAAKDKAFQRALKDQRIMTLHQELRGMKKDYGRVGFYDEPNAQMIVFPKSLRRFTERRITGIDYDLFAKGSRPGTASGKEPRMQKISPSAKKRSIAPPAKNDDNVVKFVSPEVSSARELKASPKRRPVNKRDIPEKPASRASAADHRFLAEVAKAMKELRAGKSVVAYQRLETLVKQSS